MHGYPCKPRGYLLTVTRLRRRSRAHLACVCQRRDTAATSLLEERGRGFYGPYGESCYPCPGPQDPDQLGLDGEWVKCDTDALVFPVSNRVWTIGFDNKHV
eukprot:1750872-Pyramimonas_sp.AAC.1